MRRPSRSLALAALLVLATAACGGDAGDESAGSDDAAASTDAGAEGDTGEETDASSDLPVVVATTNILGDVVEQVVGDQAEVVTIMPAGSDPHDFQASAQQANTIREADALVVNGGAFEEGLLDVIEGAEGDGVATFAALDAVDTLEYEGDGHDHGHEDKDGGEHGDDEHGDEDHGDEEHGDEDHSDEAHGDEDHGDEEHGDEEHGDEDHSEDEHGDEDHGDEDHGDEGGQDHGDGADPHFFTDPVRMAGATGALVAFLADEVDGIDVDALRSSGDAYLEELADLDATVESTLSSLDDEERVLVTNHEVFGYFADRYDFEVVGTIIPSTTTGDGVSPADLADLADTVRDEDVSAVFADTSSSDDLADTLASEVGDVEVVELYSESLGDEGSDGATYVDMVRTNAERIAAGLGG